MKIEISEIVIDETVYPRNMINEFIVRRMIDAFEAGSKFPNVILEAVTNRLVDGRHRVEVYKHKGITKIDVTQKTYISDAEFFADAVRLNVQHGMSLSAYDIRNAIARLEAFGFERDKISEAVKLPPEKIDQIVKGFAQSVDGQALALKGGLRHKKEQVLSDKQVSAMKHYGGASGVFYIRQLISLLENDLWPHDSDTFRREMDRLTARWGQINELVDATPTAA